MLITNNKIRIQYLVLVVGLFIFNPHLFSQTGDYTEILKLLPADSKFEDVKLSIEKHFNRFGNEQERNRNGYKQWKRWEWFAGKHLDPDGRVGAWTKRSMEGLEVVQQMELAPTGPQILSANGSWTSVGPGSISNGEDFLGRVESIAFHPSDADILYVGSGTGGLWRSTNQGSSWTALTDHLPSLSVASVVVQQNNANIIYILTGDGDGGTNWGYYVKERSSGVFKSTDGGTTWQPTGLNWGRSDAERYGFKLIQSPNNSSLLLAATSDGVWRTINAGNTWTRVLTGEYSDIIFRSGNPDFVAAIPYSSSILRKSDDGGETWTQHTIPNSSGIGTTRSMLAVTADRTDSLYILMGNKGNGNFRGLYRNLWTATGNSGFSLVTNTPNVFTSAADGSGTGGFPWWAIGFAVNRTNSAQMLVGGVIGRRSTDGGVTNTAAQDVLHADIHGYYQNPLDNSVYCAHDGGLSRSTNFGTSWTNISTNLRITQYYRISATPGNEHMLLGGTQDNGHHIRYTNSSVFRHTLTCCDGMDNAINPDNRAIVYMCSQDGGLNRSTDSGKNWTAIRTNASSWVTPIALHTSTPSTIFKAENTGVWRSTDHGLSSWRNLGSDGRGAIAQGVSNTSRFYAAADNSTILQRSDNINEALEVDVDWTTISGTTGWPSASERDGTIITSIAVNPSNSLDVWVTFSGYQENTKVYRSTNGGDSWSNLTGSLPNLPAHTIKIRDLGGGNWEAYLGTDIGVFLRTNSFGWSYFSNGLPRVIVTDIELNDTYVYAGTYGRGIWKSDLYSSCSASFNLSATFSSERVFQASGTIVSTSTISSTAGTNVVMKAGNYIQLNPGFVAQSGTRYVATAGPCGAVLLPQNQGDNPD